VYVLVASRRADEPGPAGRDPDLPLLYNIVGRAMNGHADVDDVVQETLLRVIRNISDLRDPRAFRSWLVAIAIRQVRGCYQAHALAVAGTMAGEGPAREADFAGLTILQLGLPSQQRETAEATRWLDEDDRELLALWWQEAAGRIGRQEVAAALGLPPRHAAVRIARLKEQLATARIVVRALHEVPPCGDLAVVRAPRESVRRQHGPVRPGRGRDRDRPRVRGGRPPLTGSAPHRITAVHARTSVRDQLVLRFASARRSAPVSPA
jgi:RNA polymerase sigma factor (sigma-70 family)